LFVEKDALVLDIAFGFAHTQAAGTVPFYAQVLSFFVGLRAAPALDLMERRTLSQHVPSASQSKVFTPQTAKTRCTSSACIPIVAAIHPWH